MENRLAGQASAYLRQHAGNPVHWQPFDDAAFAEARRRDVPVFISIGYAACHWCHVMAHESFEDRLTAEQLNGAFVSVKVDREERPDVDGVYMAACQAMTGQGGWPLSVFALPDGRAFYAGTYFPPVPRAGQPSFRQLLGAVSEAWRARRGEVERQAGALAEALGGLFSDQLLRVDGGAHDAARLAALAGGAVVRLGQTEDRVHGGLGGAPKFPPSPVLEFLIRHAAGTAHTAHTADTARGLAGRTLAAMCRSAVFDSLGGGFARYSVTADWAVPHYEKMLYDNAQLLRVLAHWIRLGGSEEFPADEARDAAALTADWMVRELGLPGGGFASSLDADSERAGRQVEGGYYVWTPGEFLDALAPGSPAGITADDAARLAAAFGLAVAPLGTAEAGVARPLHAGRALTAEERQLLDRCRPALLAARAHRSAPSRDDKAVAGWNGLAVAALADASAVLDRPDLLEAAERSAQLLAGAHWDGTRLTRVSHGGVAGGVEGFLADYAAAAEGAFTLYAATGALRWYAWALDLLEAATDRFTAEGFLSDEAAAPEPAVEASATDRAPGHAGTAVLAARAGARTLDAHDYEAPSGASLLAGALLTSAAYGGPDRHRALADSLLAGLEALAAPGPRGAGWLLAVAEASLAGPLEVAVVGPLDGARAAETRALHREALLAPSPGLVVALGEPSAEALADTRPEGSTRAAEESTANGTADVVRATVPLLRGRPGAGDGGALAYVCRDFTCQLPVGTLAELREQLDRERGTRGDGGRSGAAGSL